jgi:hypothetical protein
MMQIPSKTKASKRSAYDVYAMYRDHLRDMLDSDAQLRALNATSVNPKYIAGLWDAVTLMSEAANEEADRDS